MVTLFIPKTGDYYDFSLDESSCLILVKRYLNTIFIKANFGMIGFMVEKMISRDGICPSKERCFAWAPR